MLPLLSFPPPLGFPSFQNIGSIHSYSLDLPLTKRLSFFSSFSLLPGFSISVSLESLLSFSGYDAL